MCNKLLITLVVGLTFIPSMVFAEGMFGDFESDWLINSTGYNSKPTIDRDDGWSIHPDPHATMEIFKDCTAGMGGGCAARTDITAYGEDGNFKVYNQYISDNTEKLPELDADTDRFMWYMVWPNWAATVHLGPESDDPTLDSTPGGQHYYHYYQDIVGSPDYWIQFQADLLAQHTNTIDDPVYDDETWGYIHGWVRNYIQFAYSPWSDSTDWTNNYGPYSVYVDEQEFFDWPYPDNNETVSSIVTCYYGDGDFTLHWETDSSYEANTDGTNRWGYEIRWSTTAIMDATDYAAATEIDDSGTYWDNNRSTEGEYQASFNIPSVSDNDTLYFAIAEVRRNPSDGFDSYEFTITPFDNSGGGNDTTAPTVTAFTIPATATSTTVSVSSLTANDDTAVTGYLLNQSSTTPSSSASGWTSSTPSTVTVSGSGSQTVYAWAKDAAGNVSASLSDTVVVTIPVGSGTVIRSGQMLIHAGTTTLH